MARVTTDNADLCCQRYAYAISHVTKMLTEKSVIVILSV